MSFQNGFVELKEFSKIVELLEYYSELSKLFEELDTNDDHRVSFNEFKRGFHLLGEDDSDEHYLKEEFKRMDHNGGGFILFDEVSCSEGKHRRQRLSASRISSSASIWPAAKCNKCNCRRSKHELASPCCAVGRKRETHTNCM